MKLFWLRFVTAIACGLGVSAFCLSLTRGMMLQQVIRQHSTSQDHVNNTAKQIQQFQHKTGQLPTNLNGLKEKWFRRDPWNHDYLYSISDGKFHLKSLGRDGKVGGVGLDVDIVAFQKVPTRFALPFSHSLGAPTARGMVITSVCSGFLTALLAFSAFETPKLNATGVGILVLKAVLIFIPAVFVAFFITLAHAPGGH